MAEARLHARRAVAAVLGERPQEAGAAFRAALEALERAGAVRDAERTIRAIATALDARPEFTVTTRTNLAPATCDAPNCAGHRTRA
jgi:hypothetical protein